MHPIILKIGPLTIYSFGLMLAVAFLAAIHTSERLARRYNVPPEMIPDLGLYVLVAAVLGSRLLYVLVYRSDFVGAGLLSYLKIWEGGMIFYGGAIGAILVGLWYVRRKGCSAWSVLDIVSPAAALGHAFGRVGCFLNGCCWGKRCSLPWAVRFPKHLDKSGDIFGSPAFKDHLLRGYVNRAETLSLEVHPTQLYSVLFLVILFFVLLWLLKRRKFVGAVFCQYIIIYGCYRFLVEFIRDDSASLILGLTPAQTMSLPLVVLGCVLYWLRRSRGVVQEPVPPPKRAAAKPREDS